MHDRILATTNVVERVGSSRRRHECAVAALALAAVAAILLSPALHPDRILAPVDLVFETPVYAPEAPDDFEEPANPHLFDQTYQFVPWRHYAWESMRDGRLPLWNPLSATGTPFVATLQAAVFYPLNLLTLPLPFAATLVVSALARLWIAGFTTYLLLRRYGSSHYAGLLSGVSFMLSGFIVAWLGHPHTNVAVWLPALVLAADGLIDANDLRATLRWWSALAMITGVQFLGGHIETSADILLAAGIYAAVRLTQRNAVPVALRIRTLLAAGSGVVLGAGIAAIQLAPFIEWLPLSAEYQERSGFQFQFWNFDFHQFLALPVAIMPNLYGNPTWEGPYWSFNPWGSFNESVLYAGVVPLGLATVALARWRADSIARAWAITGGIALALALRVPLADWFNQLPGSALSHPGRLRLVAIFAVAVLAGRGLDLLARDQPGAACVRGMRRYLLGILALTGAIAVMGGIGLQLNEELGADAVSYAVERFDPAGAQPRSIAICRERVDECGGELVDAFALMNWPMYLPLGASAATLALLWSARRRPLVGARVAPALAGLTALELLLIGFGFNPAVPANQLFPASSQMEAAIAARSDGRVTALQQDSLPDAHMLHGVADVRGLDFKTVWYERYLDASGNRIPWIANGVLLDDVGPLIAALDVRTVLTANPHIVEREVSEGSMTVVSSQDGLTILQPTMHRERAAMVYQIDLAADDDAAARMLASDPQRIFEGVILPDDAAARRTRANVDASDPNASVESVVLEAERVAWDVETEQPGVLVVTDAFYPGWVATVDGVQVEIMRANIAFRAVYIPAGRHRVEMRYEPRWFRIGALVSAVSTAVVFAVLGMTWLPVLRRRDDA